MPQQPASSSTTSAPGMRSQQRDGRRRAGQRLLVAVAVEHDPPAADRRARGRAAARRRRSPRPAAPPRAAPGRPPPAARGSPGSSARCSSRSVSRQDGSQPTIGTPRSASGASRSAMSAAMPRAWSSRPLEMLARPQQPPLSSRTRQPGGLEQLDRRAADARLGEGGEGVGEEHDLAARRRRPPPAPAGARCQRTSVSRAKRGSGRRRSMPGRALEQRAQRRHAAGQVRQRRGRRAEPVERADRAEQPRAQRDAVDVLVVREELRLHASPCRRCSGHSLLHALHSRQRSRISCRRSSPSAAFGSGWESALHERVGAPARGVLLLARGHVGRAHHAAAGLAAGADPLAAVGGAAHAAVLGEGQARARAAGRAGAPGRAGRRSSARASTITPGVQPPVRVEQRA